MLREDFPLLRAGFEQFFEAGAFGPERIRLAKNAVK
jgi:hypothetical protein